MLWRLAFTLLLVAMPLGRPGAQNNLSLEGQLLVAEPRLDDPAFAHAVVLVIKHDERGAFGVVVNRPVRQMPIAVIQEMLGQEPAAGGTNVTVHLGGPLDLEAMTILHTSDYRSVGTVPITDEISVTGSVKVIEDMANGRGPRQVMLSIGYAGWAPGLLEAEMASGLWVSIPLDLDLIFADDKEAVWAEALRRRGIIL